MNNTLEPGAVVDWDEHLWVIVSVAKKLPTTAALATLQPLIPDTFISVEHPSGQLHLDSVDETWLWVPVDELEGTVIASPLQCD